jgi:putative chitinase
MADLITGDRLKAFFPHLADLPTWTGALTEAAAQFEIASPERTAAFLAQIAHESGECSRLVENLNYSAARLMAVWPKRFATLDKALPYEHQAEKLANYVYAKRLGNGDVPTSDGWLFRGRGLLQVTGRANYHSIGQALGLPLDAQPELLSQPRGAALSAAYFWKSRGLNELADDRNDDDDDEDFVTISVIINGGRAGLDSRRGYWAKAKVLFA